jgi:hypothetical protein
MDKDLPRFGQSKWFHAVSKVTKRLSHGKLLLGQLPY